MNRDREVLLDAIQACNLILQFCKDLNFHSFANDPKTQSSVLYQIVIIGEAVNRLSLTFSQINPNIPIDAIRGMRNRVIHEYKEVDLKILWEVVSRNIPELLLLLQNSTLTPEP